MLDRSQIRALSSKEWAVQKRTLLPALSFTAYCEQYHRLSRPWVEGGFNVLPGYNKRPAPGHRVGRGDSNLGRPNAPRVSQALVDVCLKAAWTAAGGGPGRGALPPEPLLWPSSQCDWPLVVFDADNEKAIAWGREHFGPPNLRTRKGAHWYLTADPDYPVTSHPLLPAEGAKGDVKAWCGLVVAPGGLGGVYEHVTIDPSACPDFPYELFGQLKTTDARKRRRHAMHTGILSYAPGITIAGDTLVKREGGEVVPLEDCEGDRIHAPYRLDRNPSATLSRWDDGRLVLWDPGAKDGKNGGTRSFVNERYWQKILAEACERFGDEPTQPPHTPLLRALQQQGVNAMPCPRTADGRFVNVPPADGITFVIAGHGLGKTYSAKRFFRNPEQSVLTVTNTTFLAEANAKRFDLTSYSDADAITSNRLSTTLESLPKFDLFDPDVFHVDEADAVLGFLFSSVCSHVVSRFASLRHNVNQCKRVVITSADLDFDYILTFLSWVKPETPVRVFVDVPKPGSRHVELVSTLQAKRDLWDCLSEKKPGVGSPVVVGITERRDVAALSRMFEGYGYRCGWLSADNSNLIETIERVRNIDEYLAGLDVLFFSPTLQSGVSVQIAVSRVFVIHTIQSIDVEVVAQMAMRFRHPECTTITWGVKDWAPQLGEFPVDSGSLNVHLDCLEADMNQVSLLGIQKIGVPTKAAQHDLSLIRAWRTVERRARRSFRDPSTRIHEVCEGHGWSVQDSRCFSLKWKMPGLSESKTEIRTRWEERILLARDLTPEEEAFPSHKYSDQETQDAFEKERLLRFYGRFDKDIVARHSKNRISVIRRYVLTAVDDKQFLRLMRSDLKELEVAECPRRAKPYLQAGLLRLVIRELLPAFERSVVAWEEVAGQFYRRYRKPCREYLPPPGERGYAVWLSRLMALIGGESVSRQMDYIKYRWWSFETVAGDGKAQLGRMLVKCSESALFDSDPPSVLDIG